LYNNEIRVRFRESCREGAKNLNLFQRAIIYIP
jgi:hypothetical protein